MSKSIRKATIFLIVGGFVSVVGICLFFTKDFFTSKASSPSNVKEEFYYQLPYKHPYLDRAENYFSKHTNDSALTEYKKAIPEFKKESNWNGYVKCCYKIGACFNRLGMQDSSFRYLFHGKRKAYETIGPQDIGTVFIHYYLGEFYRTKGLPEEALIEFVTAKSLLDTYHPKDHPSTSYILDLIGEMYLSYRTNPGKAEEYYKEALRIRENNQDVNSIGMAENYFNLSKASNLKGDYEKALSYNEKAMNLYSTFEGNFVSLVSNCQNMAGNIFFEMANYPKAIEKYHLAIKTIQEETVYKTPLLINFYNNLGAAYMKANQLNEALKSVCLSISLNTDANLDSVELVESYFHLGNNFELRQDFDMARKHFAKGLALSARIYPIKHPRVSSLYQHIGKLHAANNRFDSALYFTQKALCSILDSYHNCENVYDNPLPSHMHNNLQLLTLLMEKGEILQIQHKKETGKPKLIQLALNCYVLCDHIIKLNRLANERESSKLFMAALFRNTYEQALKCTYQLYHLEPKQDHEANFYSLLEKSKSNLLLESLREIEALNDHVIPDSIKRRERNLQSNLSELDFSILRIKGLNWVEQTRLNELRKLDSLKLGYERRLELLKKELYDHYPNYYLAKYKNGEVPLSFTRQLIGESDQVISYFWGDSAIFILGISKQEIKIHRLKKVQKIEQALQGYTSLLTENPISLDQQGQRDKFIEYIKIGKLLYDSLLSPVLGRAHKRGTNQRLVILPDGPLSAIPFESLLIDSPKSLLVDYKTLPYVVNRYQTSYSNSCTILFEKNKGNSLSLQLSPLFFSYSLPKKEQIKQNAPYLTEKDETLHLPNSDKLEDLASSLGGEYCLATKNNILSKSPHFDIIHFYVHSIPDRQHHVNNKLLLVGKESKGETALYQHELYGMDYKNKLVVLNACETGVGKEYKGEGVYSMARGFTYAGSSSVIMSLWKIDEGPTFQLTKNFYALLASQYSPSQAIQLAKLRFLKNQDQLSAHPTYWAGIIGMDNQYSISISTFHYRSVPICITLLLLVLLVALLVL